MTLISVCVGGRAEKCSTFRMCLNLNTCVLKETAVDIDGYMVTKNKREKHKSLIKENWHTKRNQQK